LLVVEEELGSWPGNGAQRWVETTGQVPARCLTWSFLDSQFGTVRTRAVPLSAPGVGVQVAAYTLTTHWNGRGDTHEILLFARSDTRRVLYDYAVPVGRSLNRAESDRILAAALRKLPRWQRG
jgi:hypothetical protein